MAEIGALSDDESEDEEVRAALPPRPTPLEVDINLQVAELIFRSILEGKRLGVFPSQDTDTWNRQILGDAWVQRNRFQRKEVDRQARATGENSPMWMEALANISDIAWEVLESTSAGEKVRKLKDISREEIVGQFQELLPKLAESFYARCGVSEKLFGFRACIAIFRLFMHDPEVLEYCATCLRLAISDREYSRDGLAELTVPLPPLLRADDSIDRGWSFLRYALDAFVVQGGGDAFGGYSPHAELEGEEGEEKKGEPFRPPERQADRRVAVEIAQCVLATRGAPALQAQLRLLREPTPEDACVERKELQLMVPVVYQKALELNEQEPHEALAGLLGLLRLARGGEEGEGEGEGGAPALPQPPADPGAEGSDGGSAEGQSRGMFRGIAAGVRGLLGR